MKIVIDIDEEIYKKYMDDRTHATDVLHAVRCGTPLEKQLQWIPVSKKPQEGRYLCTYEHYDGKCIDFGSFDGKEWYIKPIAYMPLPEPYAESEEEE